MNCQKCHEPLEPGAAFCGNCGRRVPTTNSQDPKATSSFSSADIPSYALAAPNQHVGETSAVLAVIFGIIGIVGSGFLIPIIGLVFGVAGLSLGTVSRRKAPRRLAVIGLIIAALAIAAAFAALVYNLDHNKSSTKNVQTGQNDRASKVLSKLSTPCYSFNLIDQYNISNSSGDCSASAFNGQTFASSTSVYKIVATKAGTNNPIEFTQIAKQAIDTDIRENLPDFTVTHEGPSSFAGSLAYSVYAINKKQNTAAVEIGVLHQTKNGDNAFDMLHAVNGSSTNLQSLEAQWQWK